MVTEHRESGCTVPDVGAEVLRLLRRLGGLHLALPVDQLTHALLTATLAEADGAGEELVVAALCHDMGKVVDPAHHGPVAATILAPYVDPDVAAVLWHHEDFRAATAEPGLGYDPGARARHRGAPWFDTAVQFSDAWDARALDPLRTPRPLSHFEPMVRAVLARPRPARREDLP